MRDWIKKKDVEKLDLLRLVAGKTNLPDFMIEKDWWVTASLEAVFSCSLQSHFAFKGGTSLSKAWGLLNRFSEDIDIVIDKSLFGVSDDEVLGSGKRTKLRKDARHFIINKVTPAIQEKLLQLNIPQDQFNIQPEITEESDKDPTVLLIDYKPVSEITNGYTNPSIKIEIGVRAMMEPTEERPVCSLLAEHLIPEELFKVKSVLPQRTFWEKAFLLHELFQKPSDKIDTVRMSRHWYDLHCLAGAGFSSKAIGDEELFKAIRNHRKVFTKVQGVDYDSLLANAFNLFPPEQVKTEWEKDYKAMQQSYIYKDAPSLEELESSIGEITDLFGKSSF